MKNPKSITQPADKKEKYQSVLITLSDGSVHQFTGKSFARRGDTRKIVDIKFTYPRKLPDDTSWGEI